MKKIGIILIVVGLSSDLFGQGIPTVLQRYRHLGYFSPAMAGVNDYVDINLGHGIQPLGSGASVKTTMVSGFYSTTKQAHSGNNAIRGSGTETMENYYKNRDKRSRLKVGFGTAIYSEDFGAFTKTFNSNNVAVHVPVADHTYLSLGLGFGFNATNVDLLDLTLRTPDDPVYQAYLQTGGSNTNLHIDAGLAINSHEYYFSFGVNNIANAQLSGDELDFNNPIISNFQGGYRFFHTHSFEAIAVTNVTFLPESPTLWNVGMRGRINQIVLVGVNYTSSKAVMGQFGVQLNDIINLGYTFSTSTGNTVVTSSHEIGVGIRLMNHNNYSPIW